MTIHWRLPRHRAAVFSGNDLAPIYMARLQVPLLRSQARLYAANVDRLQERFPHVVVAPADEPLFVEGQQQLAAAAENILGHGRHFAQLADVELSPDEPMVTEALDAYEDQHQEDDGHAAGCRRRIV